LRERGNKSKGSKGRKGRLRGKTSAAKQRNAGGRIIVVPREKRARQGLQKRYKGDEKEEKLGWFGSKDDSQAVESLASEEGERKKKMEGFERGQAKENLFCPQGGPRRKTTSAPGDLFG